MPIASNVVNLPPPPADTPTAADFIRAKIYSQDVELAHATHQASDTELLAAHEYQTQVLYNQPNGVLARALAAALADALPDALAQALAPLSQIAARSHNRTAGSGAVISFEIVPFDDGKKPSDYNLPRIDSVDALNRLNSTRCKAYIKRYYPEMAEDQIPNSLAERRALVRRAIGCMVEA